MSECTNLDLRLEVERVIEQMRKMRYGQMPDAEEINDVASPYSEQA